MAGQETELLHTQAIEAIKNLILADGLRPGDRMPSEDKLVERLGYSRTVVREATKYLAARGVTETLQGQGTFVRAPGVPFSISELALMVHWDSSWLGELVELRLVLEMGVARWVVQRIAEVELNRMTTSIFQSRKLIEGGDLDIRAQDCEFHLAYLAAAKNRAIEGHGALIRRFFSTKEFAPANRTPQTAMQSVLEHIEIQQSILRGDVKGLQAVLGQHLERRLEAPGGAAAPTAS